MGAMEKFDEKRLQGLCKNCMRRKKCDEARRYLDMVRCSRYKVHKNRKHFSV